MLEPLNCRPIINCCKPVKIRNRNKICGQCFCLRPGYISAGNDTKRAFGVHQGKNNNHGWFFEVNIKTISDGVWAICGLLQGTAPLCTKMAEMIELFLIQSVTCQPARN